MCGRSDRRVKRTLSIWGIMCLLCILPSFLYAQAEVNQSVSDSLVNLLRRENTSQNKIPVLKNLVNLYWQHPEEVTYMEMIIDLSWQVDSFKVAYDAMAGLCRYYFNDNQVDSLLYWRNQLDSMSLIRKETPEALFKVGNLLCRKYLLDKNYELAMNEALRLHNRAEKDHDKFGLMSANQDLGLVYQSVRRDHDAMNAFRDGLKHVNRNWDSPSFRLQYLSDMIISSLRLDDYKESFDLVKLYEDTFNKEEKAYKEKGQIFPMRWHAWYIDCFYAKLYIKTNQLRKAKIHLEEVDRESVDEEDEDMRLIYYKVAASYYQKVKSNALALRMIDNALAIDSDLVVLKQKVEVLKAEGHLKESLTLYDKLLKKNSLVSNEAFLRQMAQLQYLNDLNEKNKRENELQHQNEQIRMNQGLIVLSTVFALILLLSLYFLYRYYKHTCFFKNELQEEKDALVESGEKLQLLKEAAEEANRKKTAFIANISHEVRTPLNAIVGFSELLAEGVWESGDKEVFRSTINKNGELLMNLINDVLDLSRLESGDTRFAFAPLEIVTCCQKMLDEIRLRVLPGVKVTFDSPLDMYVLNTDPFRFKQLVGKLLLNASKFTKEGEIRLSYELDAEKDTIRFMVADTGCGIPLEKRTLVFERFEKLDDFVQGTGLGLPICRMIADKLGGSLMIDPTYLKGTRFIFTHPVK